MSDFNCEHCGTAILDSPKGYVSECEHYPIKGSNIDKRHCGLCQTSYLHTDGHECAIYPTPSELSKIVDDHNARVSILNGDVVNKPFLIDGLALQSPTPEQELPDLVGEMVALNQKVMDLETAKNFHMACIENLVERLNDVEGKLKSMERPLGSLELQRLRGNG